MKKKPQNLIPPSYPGIKKLLLTMKLTLILIIITVLQVSANVYSQTSVTLDMKDKSIRDVLKTIEQQTEIRFFFSDDLLAMNDLIDVKAENRNIISVLDDLFIQSPLTYKAYENNLIVIVPKNFLQQKKITGIITDKSGAPLAGVNIRATGTAVGVISDTDGKYSIDVPVDARTLTFTFVGMETQEVLIGDRIQIDITMEESAIGLEEVVVVGYGTQRKSDITGSVVSVSNEEITARPVTNVFQALQGKAAGVDITTSLRPGELGRIYIRGARSLTASNSPLYVVDGIPIMSGSGIETLNEQDIESIEILKDASATAIYGSRGANGVVLVTTKRGTDGQFQLNYSGSLTNEKMIWRSGYMDVAEFMEFSRWGAYYASYVPATGIYSRVPGNAPTLANDGTINYFTAEPVAWQNIQKGWASGTWDPSQVETFDWLGQVTQPTYTQEHTLSASGGTKTMKAYGSIGYLNNQGTTKGQEYQRYTLRTNVELNPKDWITFGAGVNGSWQYQDYGQSRTGGSSNVTADLIAAAARIEPYSLPYDADGNRIVHPGGKARVWNVIDEWKYSTNQRETLRLLGSLFAEVKLPLGIRYRLNFGPDFRFYRNGYYNDSKSIVRELSASNASVSNTKDFSYTIDNLLYYDNKFGAHTIGATLLQTASKWTSESSAIAGQGIQVPSQMWYALGNLTSAQLTSWSSGLTERQLASYMARVNYNYANKYLLTLSGRWDGASQLAEGKKWAFFPSAAIAWRLDQESFLDRITWLDQLKLRLGVGTVGNSAVNLYSTKGSINQVTVPFGTGTESGYTLTNTVANPELGWEKTTQYNLAVDFSVMKGRVNGTIEAYRSSTTDLLLTVALPSVSGFTSTIANVGETSNRGIEFTINSNIIEKSDFSWRINATAAWQRDQIESLMNGKEDMVADTLFIGEPIKVIYDYERIGIWQDTPEDQAEMALFNANGSQFAPGKIRVKDQNGDYRIDGNYDRVIIGNTRPLWTLGLTNTFSYKGIELSAFLTGRLKYMSGVGEALTGMYGDQRVVDYWTPDNTGAEYQRPFMSEAGGDTYASTYYKDDSWIKIRNISLGYQLPMSLLGKVKINSLRVYAQIQNAGMLWSRNNFRDAEYNTLYFNRGYVFGINVGF
ncbi:MAG: TonB-dependent receptor [Bacteroidia bacterium]|nr:TonB-dependent receptor [Bacteroidia bacterium]